MAVVPIVAAILYTTAEDDQGKDDQIYSDAYGLEMQIDNEWNAEIILLAPPNRLYAVTKNTGVTGEDTAIVSAGITDVPISSDGKPDVSEIKHPQNNWLIVGDPQNYDTDETITLKLRTAIDAGCRVIYRVSEKTIGRLASNLNGVTVSEFARIVIAITVDEPVEPGSLAEAEKLPNSDAEISVEVAKTRLQIARAQFQSVVGTTNNLRFIFAGAITAEKAVALVSNEGFDGVLLTGPSDFCTILEILGALAG